MKTITKLKQQSNDQLNDRLREINISIVRFQGYNKGGCSPPPEVASGEQRNNSMYFQALKRERAQILTILNERLRAHDHIASSSSKKSERLSDENFGKARK